MQRKSWTFLVLIGLAFSLLYSQQPDSDNPAKAKPTREPEGATVAPILTSDHSYVGEIRAFAAEKIPDGWLECNGKSLVRGKHQQLFSVIGDRFGSVAAGEFNVPDLRGSFLRGWNHGKESSDGSGDPDSKNRIIPPGAPNYPDGTDHVGTDQYDAFETHKHNDLGHTHNIVNGYRDAFVCGSHCGALTGGAPATKTTVGHANLSEPVDMLGGSGVRTSKETRPTNVYVLFCIRDGKK